MLSVCENTSNSGLWLALGITRSNIHVFLDRVAVECTSEIVTEEVVKSLLVEIVGTELLEENGKKNRKEEKSVMDRQSGVAEDRTGPVILAVIATA